MNWDKKKSHELTKNYKDLSTRINCSVKKAEEEITDPDWALELLDDLNDLYKESKDFMTQIDTFISTSNASTSTEEKYKNWEQQISHYMTELKQSYSLIYNKYDIISFDDQRTKEILADHIISL